MTQTGLFITLEGIDGAGKSTAMEYINQRISQAPRKTRLTREPGGTVVGEQIREILLNPHNQALSMDAELLLMFAARAQHLNEVIRPALECGDVVICNRFTDSSYAYQGGGRGIEETRIRLLQDWTQQELQPDLTLLFNIDVETGLCRAGKRSQADLDDRFKVYADRFEQETMDFFERVRNCYLQRARRYPERYRLVESGQPLDNVKQQIDHILQREGLC